MKNPSLSEETLQSSFDKQRQFLLPKASTSAKKDAERAGMAGTEKRNHLEHRGR